MVRSHDTAVRILMAAQITATVDRWRERSTPLILVEPEVTPGTFALSRAFAHVEAGYRAAYRELAAWGGGAGGKEKKTGRER
jgi:hypothetical protein